MKGYLLLFVVLLNSLRSFADSPPPVVDFNFDNNNTCSGTAVHFTSTVTGDGPYIYAWNFGGSGTSSQANPTHSFTSLGCGTQNFNISLSVTDSNGEVTTVSKIVIVKQKPSIDFVDANNPFDPFNNCQGANPGSPAYSITLGNNSASSCFTSVVVNWGDGNSQSNPVFPLSHTYSNLGAYSLLITVTGTNGCVSAQNFVVKNISNPSGSLTSPGGTTNLCSPTANLHFAIGGDWGINSDDTVYTIDYGDNTPILTFTQAQLESSPYFNAASPIDSNDYPIPHSYLISSCPGGSFTAQLVITNACSPTPFTTSNIVILKKPEANFQAPATACVNANVQFINTTVSGFNQNCNQHAIFTWNFGDGSPIVTTSPTLPQNISHQFSSPGTYTVTLSAQGFCGTSTISKTICIEPPLAPQFTVNQTEGCAPLSVNTNNTTPGTAVCAATTYSWSVTHSPTNCGSAITPIPNQTTANATFNFAQPGSYNITLTTTNSCGTQQSSQIVIVKKPPTASINLIANLCGTGSITPQALVNSCAPTTSTLTYAWTFPGGTPSTSAASNPGSISYSATGPHDISLIVTNECGSSTAANQTFTLNAAPTITNNNLSQTICAGTSMAAIALTSSIAGTTYSWTAVASAGVTGFQSNGTAATIPSQIINYSGSGTGTLTYTVTPTVVGCSGTPAVFQIQITAAPAITAQPQGQTMCQSAAANPLSISINAGSATPTYQWYSNTSNSTLGGTAISGATLATYTPPTNVVGTLYYYVIASLGSGGCSALTSQVAVVMIQSLPQITSQPVTLQQVCVGGSVETSLAIAVSGGNGSTTYQWYSNTSNSNSGGTLITSAINSSYTPPAFTTAGTYYYYAIASYSGAGCGNVTSQVSQVDVIADPSVANQPVASQNLCQGASPQNLVVSASGGVGLFSYQWYSNTSNTTIGGILIPGATTASYTPQTTNVGTLYYYCIISQAATPGCSATSAIASVVVNTSPSVVNQPASSQVCLGGVAQTLSFTTFNGSGTASYQWYSNTVNSNVGGTLIPSATNSSYVPPTTTSGTLWYYCEITFSGISGSCATIATQPAMVEVTPGALILQQPTVTQTLCVGSGLAAPLTVSYSGGSGTPTYQWYSNTQNTTSGGTPVGTNSASFTPPVYTLPGEHFYYVSIQLSASGCAPVTSDAANVSVVADPVVLTQPVAAQTLCPNETATTLSVSVSGGIGTSYTYQWYVSSSATVGTGTAIAGANAPDYVPPTVVAGMQYYYCIIEQPVGNGCNAESAIAAITVSPAPQVTAQPQSQTVCGGGALAPLSFTVINGVGAPIYQWYSNTTLSNTGGSPIVNANSPTYLPNNGTVGTFYYYGQISYPNLAGACASVATDPVQISIEQNPVISNQAQVICSGNAFTVTPVTGGSDIVPASTTYTWTNPVIVPAGAVTGASAESIGQANISQQLTNTTTSPANVTYTVTPLAGNCQGLPFDIIVTVNPAINPNITLSDNLCFGANSASITTNVTGGIPFPGSQPYQFAWTGPGGFASSATIVSNLAPGQYSVTITDAGGCPFSQAYTISEPAQLAFINAVETDITCNGSANGFINIDVVGGTLGYTYTWTKNTSFYSNAQNLSNLDPGTYEVTVSDANNCGPITMQFTITEPQPLAASISAQTNVECFGQSTGTLSVLVTGGTSGYSFAWSGPDGFASTNQNITGLFAGNYTLSVTDANGCQFTLPATITQSPEIIISYTATEITCYGANDANMSVQLSGGVGPYSFVWSNLSTSLTQTNLSAGDYTITVTDALGCVKSSTINIPEAPLFMVSPVVTQISCHGAHNGSIQLNLTGGISPVTLVWSDGSTAGLTRNGLGPGVYTATITDSKPCQIVSTFVITDPQPLTLSAQIDNALNCTASDTGAIDLLVSGGTPPYAYLWSTGSISEDLTQLTNGNYAVTVIDSRGCVTLGQYTILRPEPISITVSVQTDFDCETHEVDQHFVAQVAGGMPPYQLQWSNGTISGVNNEIMETDDNGIVILTATDALNCTATFTLTVDIPEIGYADFEPESFGNASFGIFSVYDPITFASTLTGDYETLIWDFGDGTFSNEINPVHTYLTPGSYVVSQTVTYPFGCQYTRIITLLVEEGYFLVIPTAFTPNNDSVNDNYRPVSKRLENIRVDIFDSWGSMIYSESGDTLSGWDGTVNSVPAENGNYYCTVTAKTFYNHTITETKTFVLIK